MISNKQVLNPQKDISGTHSFKLIHTYIATVAPLAEVNQEIYPLSYKTSRLIEFRYLVEK